MSEVRWGGMGMGHRWGGMGYRGSSVGRSSTAIEVRSFRYERRVELIRLLATRRTSSFFRRRLSRSLRFLRSSCVPFLSLLSTFADPFRSATGSLCG